MVQLLYRLFKDYQCPRNQKLQTICRPEDYIRRNKAESFNRKLSDTISGTIPSLIYISC